jgi:gluconate 5-dehydrogenase
MSSLKDQLNLSGKVAVVSGGYGWLGSSITEVLCELGAQVVILSRNKTVDISGENEQVCHLSTNVCSESAVNDSMQIIFQKFGRIDVLVNNAFSGEQHNIEQTDLTNWRDILEAGLDSVFLCSKAASHHMLNAGASIVNVSSMYGLVSPQPSLYKDLPYISSPAYGVAKAGVCQLTRYFASFLGPSGIRVNAIAPGPFPNPEVLQDLEFSRRLAEKTMLNRVGKPDELKGLIALLSSDASSFITGQTFIIDGGWTSW